MEKKIPFAPQVMLIDASYLDRVGTDLATHFAPIVKRELPKADLANLLECLALDAGMQPGNNEIQVIFIYEPKEEVMKFCTPSHLEKELHNVGFQSQLGEFSLYAFQPSGMATREDLFRESLMLMTESKDILKAVLVPDEDAYGSSLEKLIPSMKHPSEVTVFGMNPPEKKEVYRFELLGFSILQALGVHSEEL